MNEKIFPRNFELQRCCKSDIAEKPDIERRKMMANSEYRTKQKNKFQYKRTAPRNWGTG